MSLFRLGDNRYTVFSTYLVRNLTQLCPRSFRLSALIMLGGKAQTVIQICVVENDVAMQVRLVMMNSNDILIIAFQITVAQLLSDLHSLFGRDFTGGKALYHVVGKDLGASCSCVSDGSEVLACSCAIGSASIRVDI